MKISDLMWKNRMCETFNWPVHQMLLRKTNDIWLFWWNTNSNLEHKQKLRFHWSKTWENLKLVFSENMQWIAQQSRISTLHILFYGTKTYSFFGCSQHVHKVFMHMTFRCVNRLLQPLCMKRNWLHEINFHCSLLTSFCYVVTSADVNPLHDNTLVKCYQIELLQTYYAIFYILTHFTHPLKDV